MRVLYDDQASTSASTAGRLHAPIVKRLQRRDGVLPSDGVWIDIDSRDDGVSAFHFGVNAAGVLQRRHPLQRHRLLGRLGRHLGGQGRHTGHGYRVEIRIPLGVAALHARPVQEWGFQVRRAIDARQETDDWAFFPRSAAGFVSRFGRLTTSPICRRRAGSSCARSRSASCDTGPTPAPARRWRTAGPARVGRARRARRT